MANPTPDRNDRPSPALESPPKKPLIVEVDAGTLLAIVALLLFVPLILTGFLAQ
ncbi:hypothetical protein [Prochlorothrix hollandica]|uniref:hypothetical protein n=1 Tax=Prochlorothrix hollandica TaxID=1223 RepID=UPI00034D52D6|nr:hypothetical protein [Prochlorothrix hollandica]